MELKLKDLRYLVAVADQRHFGRAASRCFVSQPTLSAQLKKLEQALGVQLIERAPNNVSLTPAGEEIVARARRILEASDEMVALARNHRDPLSGRLRLALLPTIGPYLLPNIAPLIRRQLPRVQLRLYEYQTDAMLEKLHAGELDMGILALPVEHAGLEVRELYREPFVVALPEQHPLAGRDSLRVADLKGTSLLLLEEGHCLRDQGWRSAAGPVYAMTRTSAPRVWRPCGRWSQPGLASRSCRSSLAAAPIAAPGAWRCVLSRNPLPCDTSAQSGARRRRAVRSSTCCAS